MKRRALELVGPGAARLVDEEVEIASDDSVIVETAWSALSPGSEALVAAGEAGGGGPLDDTIASMAGERQWPMRYGYALVGAVVAAGPAAQAQAQIGRRAFVLHPHATHAVVPVGALIPVPDDLASDVASLYATCETAFTLHLDAAILPGESVVIVGAGLVGQIVARLAAFTAADRIVVVDRDPARRSEVGRWCAQTVSTPDCTVVNSVADAREALGPGALQRGGRYEGYDVVFELTGNPAALDDAVALTGFGGRVVVGSWYGSRRHAVDLGERFHRGRIQLLSSQVSTIPAHLAGRYDYARRTALVWRMMKRLELETLERDHVMIDDLATHVEALATGKRGRPWQAVDYGTEAAQGAAVRRS